MRILENVEICIWNANIIIVLVEYYEDECGWNVDELWLYWHYHNVIAWKCIILCCLCYMSLEGEICEESEELMIMRKMISIGFVTIDYEKRDIDWLCDY